MPFSVVIAVGWQMIGNGCQVIEDSVRARACPGSRLSLMLSVPSESLVKSSSAFLPRVQQPLGSGSEPLGDAVETGRRSFEAGPPCAEAWL